MSLKPKNTDKIGRDEKGRFSKGNNGKPKGAINKTTKDLKDFIVQFLNDKSFEIPLIWNDLDNKDKATLYLHLLKQVMPKSNEIEKNVESLSTIEVNIIRTKEENNELMKEILGRLRK